MGKIRVLVCGSTGFIGRNIIEKLSLRNDMTLYGTYYGKEPSSHLVDNENINLVRVDLTKADEVTKLTKDIDILIQAAAVTTGINDVINRPYIHVTNNAIMNSLVLRSCFDNKVKHLIFFSCTTMYPNQNKPVREKDFNSQIIDKYFGIGWTKVYIEKMCEFYSRISDTKFTVLRHSNIYGPYDKFDLERSHVFGATITKVLASNSNELDVWGDGSEKRDLLYVSDLVSLVETIIEKQKDSFELLNVGYGGTISVKDLIEKIIRISGKNLELRFDTTKPTVKFDLALNIDKVRTKYKWRPNVALDEGIKNTISWYMENITIT